MTWRCLNMAKQVMRGSACVCVSILPFHCVNIQDIPQSYNGVAKKTAMN